MTLGFFSPILIVWFGLFGSMFDKSSKISHSYQYSLVLFRFAFPRAKGTSWNIALLTFIPICASLIPYLYVLEVSARYYPSKRVSETFFRYQNIRFEFRKHSGIFYSIRSNNPHMICKHLFRNKNIYRLTCTLSA